MPTTIKRKVIKTKRAKAIVKASLKFAQADVEARSQALGDPAWYAAQRLQNFAIYDNMPMPTLSDEAWRRTDIRAYPWGNVAPTVFSTNGDNAASDATIPAELLKPLVGEAHGGQIVINGGEVEERMLAAEIAAQGVVFTDFRTALREHAELLQTYLGKTVKPDAGKFAALAATLADDGVFVYVPKGVQVELPLHSIYYATRKAQFTRLLVVVDDGASLTYVHELASPDSEGGEALLHVGTVEVLVGQRAKLQFIELQSLDKNAWHFSHERSQVARDANIDWIFSAIGTRLTKNFTDLDLVGDNAQGRMSGFYFADGNQHLDHDTQQNHLALHTTSDLLFKGALKDASRSVWQGMIYVAEGAQKTDGFQANRNLVLSKKARADAIPGLEILADDVRCTHAATVGQLDQEHLFYLMTRGLDRETAQRMVVDGFFDPIMQRIPFEGVRARLKQSIEEKMA